MVFSSVTFLFYFLPFVLLFYFISPFRNVFLLLASLFFYAWGEVNYVLLLLLSITANYVFGIFIERQSSSSMKRVALVLGVIVNVGSICFFKYTNFLVENLNQILSWFHGSPISLEPVHLPLGISFFTFQAISYLIDVYRQTCRSERNPLTLGLYISMFPQLVAGPIVRFNEIVEQLHQRSVNREKFAEGVRRFVVGLGQKVIIANALAVPADAIFSLPPENLTAAIAWTGAASYTLQIYFDFAGYSSMAIGLGLMFGFTIPENFNYPYISQSITEFWRRWHMSLSGWFRDYLYIPLGGNRGGAGRTYLNLIIVFFLCGLWHGASWTFVVWGLFHGAFLVLERIGFGKWLALVWRPFGHAYVMVVVIVGWTFFRADNFDVAAAFLTAMAGLGKGNGIVNHVWQFLDREVILALILGGIGAAPIIPMMKRWCSAMHFGFARKRGPFPFFPRSVETICLAGILFLVIANLAAKTHNPFIYFRF